jgi:tetratricopeptide (TPR) repeat protein
MGLWRKAVWSASMLGLLMSPALADQNDPRLDELFAELQVADRLEARQLEQRIWGIWNEHQDVIAQDLLEHASVAMAGRDWTGAERLLNELIERQPGFAEAWNRRATLRWLTNDAVGSMHDVQQTLALEPRHFGALSGMGLILMAAGRDHGATRAFEAALALAPWLDGARQNLLILRARTQGQPL